MEISTTPTSPWVASRCNLAGAANAVIALANPDPVAVTYGSVTIGVPEPKPTGPTAVLGSLAHTAKPYHFRRW